MWRHKWLTINSSHHESNLRRISCTRKVSIDLLGFMLVERDEAVEDVVACGSVVSST